MKLLAVSLFAILFLKCIIAYKILHLTPLSSKSHMYVFSPLLQELGNRNHHVTVVSPYSFFKNQPNIREIRNKMSDEFNFETLSAAIMSETRKHTLLEVPSFKYLVAPNCELYLTNAEVKQLLQNGKQFDVVIVDTVLNECALATAPLLGKTVILQSTSSLIPWMPTMLPVPPSYVPLNVIDYYAKMNFFERMNNFFIQIGMKLLYDYDHIPYVQKVIAKHLPQNPLIVDGLKSIDFTLTNADPVITSPRPTLPNIVNIGGMHCRKAGPVPKEFEDFIKSSGENGFILFSLGSIAKSELVSKEVTDGLLKAFSRLKQNVIWKYEGELKNVPKNVKISKWLPQKDLLGHPKIRLFITHGGMLSLQESVLNAVPMIAIPLFAEQPGHSARIEEIGIGIMLAFTDMTGESMFDAITRVIGDQSYTQNIKRYSSVFRDFIENQTETAANWVEYVIRHKGAPHFRVAAQELNVFQYFLLDVTAFVLFILSIVVLVIFKLGIFVKNKFCPCKKSALQKQKKK